MRPRGQRHLVKRRLAELGHDLAAHVEAHRAEGKTPEQIADEVIDTIAATTQWSLLGPAGVMLDAVEAAVAKAIAHGIIRALAAGTVKSRQRRGLTTKAANSSPSPTE